MKIGIAGIAGRMGRLLAEEVPLAGATLVGGIIDPARDTAPPGIAIFDTIESLANACDLVIDFTHASTVAHHAQVLARTNTAWVLGTTGFDAAAQAAIEAAGERIALIAAPNYSPGVNLMMVLAERMAAALPAAQYDAEILEMHHKQKVDAPSGTALGIGRAVAQGRGQDFAAEAVTSRDGHTGPRKTGSIGFATLRGGQVVGDHSVIFAAGSERITLQHEAFDRRVFASGAVRAALWLNGRPAGIFTMRDVLGL
jgi:4-hydroxy-tetrahydrodipicolinate reductase